MSVETITDLLAQTAVDSDLEAKLVAGSESMESFLEAANAAGYSLHKDDFLALKELSDQELASVTGGAGGKGGTLLINLIRQLQET